MRLRSALLLLALVAAAPAARAAEAAPVAAATPTNDDCLACHATEAHGQPDGAGRAGVVSALFAKSAHAGLDCVSCHEGYTPDNADPDRHGHAVPPPADPADARLLGLLSAGKGPEGQPRTGSGRAYLACAGCHADSVETFKASPHGRWMSAERPVAGPSCASCHGTPHEIAAGPARGTPEFRAYWAGLARACEGCHGNAKLAEAAQLNEEVASTYHDSIHGRLVALGSTRAPLCTDCHAWSVRPSLGAADPRRALLPGGHATLGGRRSAASAVALGDPARDGDHRVQTCAQCHAGATASFAGLVSHRALQETGAFSHFVHAAFSWLTTLTLLFFAFHVAVDFVFELRQRLGRRHAPEPALAHRTVMRFDLHQRIQHWLMLSGVILLAVTGWPLRGAGTATGAVAGDIARRVDASRHFLALFGGAHGAGVAHRVGAVLIILSGLYHLVYLGTLARKRALPLSMLPTPRDALDMRDNLLFMLGLRRERPRFEKYNYLEKFDYWAVFWGIVMMVGSGFIFWFPVAFSRFLPTFVLASAQIVHGEEATLAAIFLFVVHFYNVHLKPSIFPMNWTWLTGHTTLASMKEEHPAEYERQFGDRDP